MNSRTDISAILHELCPNVYYQPPENVRMNYPAIVYERDTIRNRFANDSVYNQSHHYKVTIIDKNPDSDIVERMSRRFNCRFASHFIADGLNHDVFYIYYNN